MNRQAALSVVSAVCIIVAGCLWFITLGPPSFTDISSRDQEYLIDHEHWLRLIRDSGPASARDVYLQATADVRRPVGFKHTAAHAFAHALYQELGPEGLSYCGSEFVYGCVHELIGRTLSESGIPEDVLRICLRSADRIECEHGLGHGFLAHLGYEKQFLKDAMDLCKAAGASDAVHGCAWGVMMEWYYRHLTGDVVSDPTDPHAYELCISFEGAARAGCVYNMPSLWAHEIPFPDRDADTIAYMADRCMQLTLADHGACARGIGRMAASLPAQASRSAREMCQNAFSVAELAHACIETAPMYEAGTQPFAAEGR